MLGNRSIYNLESVMETEPSILKNKHLVYLGSSVTFGERSHHISFPEYIAKRNNGTYIKEAVSGTTLVNKDEKSYVSRLKNIKSDKPVDLFVVQLSTNDAWQNAPLGEINDESDQTICGAIRTIIHRVKAAYSCPVVFYSSPYFPSENYQQMVLKMKEIAKIEPVYFINLYEDENFNRIDQKTRSLFMADPIHPTKAGYLKWMTPKLEEEFIHILKKEAK